MNQLERQAIEKEQEKESLKRAAILFLETWGFDDKAINYFIEKSFIIGHNAGHCRGEQYKRNDSA